MEFGEVDNDKKKKVIYFEGPNLPGYLRFLSCVQDWHSKKNLVIWMCSVFH